MRGLSELCRELLELKDGKTALEERLEEQKGAIRAKEEEIIEAMIDADTPEAVVGEHKYAMKTVTHYSKLGEEKLAAAGLVYFDVLRDNGLGYLVKEAVNPKSMETAFRKAAKDNDGVLPEELAAVCSQYDTTEISVTKASKTARTRLKAAKAAVEGGTV